MSFFRHREIFPNDPGATLSDYARAHRPDESPVGYSSAGCSPASPASALPTGSQCALNSSCWSTDFHRTANCVLTVCLTPGGRPTVGRYERAARNFPDWAVLRVRPGMRITSICEEQPTSVAGGTKNERAPDSLSHWSASFEQPSPEVCSIPN